MPIAKVITALAAALAMSACGSDKNCKDACDKLASCGFSTSGLACSASCSGVDASCAECINDHSCGEIVPKCGGNGLGVCATWTINPK